MTDPFVDRLRRLDACAISDACDREGLVDRVSIRNRPLTGPVRIAGRALTIELGPPSGQASSRHLCAAAVDAGTADDVLVIDHQGRSDCPGWGGNLSRGARARRVAGTIIDGAMRDLDEAIEVDYPVFASATTPRTARGRTEEKHWGDRITFDGITVETGDYVIADSTGIVFVPSGEIEAILAAAESIAAKEAAMASDIDAGRPVSEVMGADYEALLR